MGNRYLKIIFVLIIAILIGLFFYFDGASSLTFDNIKAKKEFLSSYQEAHALQVVLIYFFLYIVITALSLPGAAMMTLAGGALFGFSLGTMVVSFASTIGATLAFLMTRWLLADWVQNKFGDRLKKINEGIQKEGAFYLFGLRLVPAFPFFVVNLVMGLTPLKPVTFFWVSQLGMLPGTMAFVNAGTQLSQITSPRDILSPSLLISFTILGLFPILAKKILQLIKGKRNGAEI